MPSLSKVELTILDILTDSPGDGVSGRDLRSLLRKRGFHRSAPALVFTMMNLQDKGLIQCRQDVRVADGVEINDRFYSAVKLG